MYVRVGSIPTGISLCHGSRVEILCERSHGLSQEIVGWSQGVWSHGNEKQKGKGAKKENSSVNCRKPDEKKGIWKDQKRFEVQDGIGTEA